MNKVFNRTFKKLIVLLVITSMLILSVKDRKVSAGEYIIKNENKASIRLFHWERTQFLDAYKDKPGYYPVMLIYPSNDGWFVTGGPNRAGLSSTVRGGFSFTNPNINSYILARPKDQIKASESDKVKNTSYFLGADEVLVGETEFYTTQITDPWCIGINVDGSGSDTDIFNLYFSMSVKDKMDYGLKIVDGFRLGRSSFYRGKNHWTLNDAPNGLIRIRHVRGTRDFDYIRCYDNQMRCSDEDNSDWDSGTVMYMYIGTEYSYTILDDKYTVDTGSALNINDKDDKGRKSICILPAGKTMIIAPGAVVIVKGMFICNGSIENFGTLLLCDGAIMTSQQTERDGACTINNYGAQAYVNLPKEDVLNYLKGSWKLIHNANIDSGTLNQMTRYLNGGNSEGNLIIREGAILAQNKYSRDMTFIGGAELVNQGQLAVYKNLLIKDSTVINSGLVSFGYGWPISRNMQNARVVKSSGDYILKDKNDRLITTSADTIKDGSGPYYIKDLKMSKIKDTTGIGMLKKPNCYSSDTIKFK